MRGTLHVLATIVLLPYVALAAGFLLLGHAIASGSLLSFFDTLIMHAAWIVPWGILGAAVAIATVALLGIIPQVRWLGGLCLCVLAAASLSVILVADRSRLDASQWLFLSPCVAVLAFGAWLFASERPSRATRPA